MIHHPVAKAHLSLIIVVLCCLAPVAEARRDNLEELLIGILLMAEHKADMRSDISDIIQEKSELLDITFIKARRLVHRSFGFPVEMIYLRPTSDEQFEERTGALTALIRADLPPDVLGVLYVNRQKIRAGDDGYSFFTPNQPKYSLAYWRQPDSSFERVKKKPYPYIRARIRHAETPYMEAYWRIYEGTYQFANGRRSRGLKALEKVLDRTSEVEHDALFVRMRALSLLSMDAASHDKDDRLAQFMPQLARQLQQSGAHDRLGSVFFGVEPGYPERAFLDARGGRAVIEVTVDAKGTVLDLRLDSERPANMGFGEAAMEAVSEWVFIPKLDEQGQPLPQFTKKTAINFDPAKAKNMKTFRKALGKE